MERGKMEGLMNSKAKGRRIDGNRGKRKKNDGKGQTKEQEKTHNTRQFTPNKKHGNAKIKREAKERRIDRDKTRESGKKNTSPKRVETKSSLITKLVHSVICHN